MRQSELFDAAPEDALEDCARALGGYQKAAAYIWPHEDPISKGRDLRDMLDPRRRAKFSERERERLIKGGAENGCLTPHRRAPIVVAMGYGWPQVLPSHQCGDWEILLNRRTA